jgi:hypothetical protein
MMSLISDVIPRSEAPRNLLFAGLTTSAVRSAAADNNVKRAALQRRVRALKQLGFSPSGRIGSPTHSRLVAIDTYKKMKTAN